MDCIFCKIINGERQCKKVYEDELCYAFLDINPMAPIHCLVVPKAHIASVNEINEQNSDVIAHIFSVIPKIAKELGATGGYRVVSNIGDNSLNVSVDGRFFTKLMIDEACVIYKSNKRFKTIVFSENNMFSVLFKKIKLLDDKI